MQVISKKGNKRKAVASAFPPGLSVVLLGAPAALLIEQRTGSGEREGTAERKWKLTS